MIDEKLFVRNIRAMTDNENCGAVSDGDHTFSELYHHRAILTAAAFNAHPEMAWKSKQHHDGTMYDGYFICGVNTVCGQATYHYALEYWDLFKVPELDRAPEWDGHTPAVAAARLAMAFCGAPIAQREEDTTFGDPTEDIPDYPPEIAALAKAAEPLRDYLLERGDPHTCAVVTKLGATLKRDEIGVAFAKHGGSDRSAEFEREIKAIVEGVER